MKSTPTFPKQALFLLAFDCAVQGLEKECTKICNGISSEYPNSPVSHLIEAISLISSNQYKKALKTLEDKALPLEQDNLITQALISFTYLKLGTIEQDNSLLLSLSNEINNPDTSSRKLAQALLAA